MVRDRKKLMNTLFMSLNYPPLTMKKFVKKIRLIINIWSIKQQLRVSEILLDSIDREIESANAKFELLKEFVDRPEVFNTIITLREDRRALAETVEFYRRRMQFLWKRFNT